MLGEDSGELPLTAWLEQPAEPRTLASIWQALMNGELVVRKIRTEGAQTLALFVERPAEEVAAHRLRARARAALERVLAGGSVESGGGRTRVVDVVRVGRGQPRYEAARAFGASRGDAARRGGALVCRTVRPDAHGAGVSLGPALARHAASARGPCVVRALVHRRSSTCAACAWMGSRTTQISARRRTSKRTVANQLASVFRELHVSGRVELVCERGQDGRFGGALSRCERRAAAGHAP